MDSPTSLFQILSDTTRIRILLLLDKSELCVCQLMGTLGMSQPRISRQLAVLKQGELVVNSRKGNWIYYKINPELTDKGIKKDILSQLPKWLDDDEIAKSDRLVLRACLKQQETTGNCDLKSFAGIRGKVLNT